MNITTATVKTSGGGVATVALPVLDVGPFLAGDPDALAPLAEELRFACENVGFMALRNHGLAPERIEAIFDITERFHALAPEQKSAIAINQHQRGYIKPGATLVRHSTYNKNTKFDSNETLVVASDYAADNQHKLAGKRFYGDNQFPDGLPGCRGTIMDFLNSTTAFGKRLLPVWATALGLAPDFFAPYFDNNFTYLRLAHYPPVADVGDNEFGLGPHSDTGFMTILPQADVEGLEILATDGTWFRPPHMDDAVIVNTGQFLERWTNGRFLATPHRVVPPRERDRYSVACFVNPAFEPVCECLPTCHGPGNPPRHEPESYWDFFSWYITNAYPHYDAFHEGQ